MSEKLHEAANKIRSEYEQAYGKPCDCATPDSALHYGRAQGMEMAAKIVSSPLQEHARWPVEAICRLIHDHAGTKSPDEPLHHPAQKSWEEPTLVRWQQWEGLVEELHELLHTPSPQPREGGK